MLCIILLYTRNNIQTEPITHAPRIRDEWLGERGAAVSKSLTVLSCNSHTHVAGTWRAAFVLATSFSIIVVAIALWIVNILKNKNICLNFRHRASSL